MKEIFIFIALLSLIFIAGCKSSFFSSKQTTTVETTIAQDIKDCKPQFLRKQILPDGSVKEYCLPADYFKLKPCSTNNDCTSAEYCDLNGYCQGLE